MSEPLRFSHLKQMSRSPAHAKFALDHPDSMPSTPAMRIGRLIHSIFLGAQAGKGAVPVVFDGERRGNAWKDFKAAHPNDEIVTPAEFEQVGLVASALHNHQEARSLLMGQRERTLLFDMLGRACRATPDVLAPHTHLVDLKSCSDASPERFPWSALRLAYHAQLAYYLDAAIVCEQADPDTTVAVVAVEVKPPYAVCVYTMTDRALDFGRRVYRGWLEQFVNCERSNTWPSYPMGVLDAPEGSLSLVGPDGEEIDVAE